MELTIEMFKRACDQIKARLGEPPAPLQCLCGALWESDDHHPQCSWRKRYLELTNELEPL